MAGNKFDTQFAIHKPKFYSLTFKDLYDEERTHEQLDPTNCPPREIDVRVYLTLFPGRFDNLTDFIEETSTASSPYPRDISGNPGSVWLFVEDSIYGACSWMHVLQQNAKNQKPQK